MICALSSTCRACEACSENVRTRCDLGCRFYCRLARHSHAGLQLTRSAFARARGRQATHFTLHSAFIQVVVLPLSPRSLSAASDSSRSYCIRREKSINKAKKPVCLRLSLSSLASGRVLRARGRRSHLHPRAPRSGHAPHDAVTSAQSDHVSVYLNSGRD
jgi:hypothetical protein